MGGGSPNSRTKDSVSKSGESAEDESGQADLPTEIAGGFLTCAYVTPEEAGFSTSDTHVPVGCAVKLDDNKVSDKRYSYKLKLFDRQKKSQPLTTSNAQPSSEWHQYGHLGRAGNHDRDLGMIVQDLDSGTEYGPLLYPVRNLTGYSLDATLNLAGGYVFGGYYQRPPQGGGRPTDLANWGIIPAAFCQDGTRRKKVEPSKDPGILGVPGVQELGAVIDALTGTQISNINIPGQAGVTKLTADSCLQKTKVRDLARGGLRPQPLPGDGEYVVAGAGCLFISYFDDDTEWRVAMYDQHDQLKYGINKGNLETFVKYHIDQRQAGKIKVKCP